ncbi:beta-galactosidase GalB [Marinoscillum sp. MHG1-6]|uniref:beta-galactosidase GalB n=1 Tax=Marinoscillum sp. MHG1-6 TaxID=2959627 RepID=UPI00215721E7|nr:beta-galactosidase GalB [Marinoscillum sp. MHG1-6]
MRSKSLYLILIISVLFVSSCSGPKFRQVTDFNWDWKFYMGKDSLAYQTEYDDSHWRSLNLPHDWSIEGNFSVEHATGQSGGALPAGIGWYRKTFKLDPSDSEKEIYIDFGGVYRNSEVWINGQYLGKRAFGYISFRYDLTPYLNFDSPNVIAIKVDNSLQPSSRWYTGSGIYRKVELVKTEKVHVAQWGTFVTTPEVSKESANVVIEVELANRSDAHATASIETTIFDPNGKKLTSDKAYMALKGSGYTQLHSFEIATPELWSVDNPVLYSALTKVHVHGEVTDLYETRFGIRSFEFDPEKGFFLNGSYLKIYGVNQHHDLGALGAAFNKRAAERQLEILKEMGVNGIRMAHNPPAEELLDLCDEMGFIVVDESFDVWAKRKKKYDYNIDWKDSHIRDLQDMVKRDRNHPSIFIWSIGNEIREQFDSTGLTITKELAGIVRELDTTRMVTSGLTENEPEKNYIVQSGALDLLSFNYKHKAYKDLPDRFPGYPMLASETSSAFATRGHYDMPSDSIQQWPAKYNEPIPNANPDYTVSAYDMISAYWGSTHEETWRVVKKLDHMAGIYIWSGFDYLGEPDPYPYPARSSYLGIIDLAGFPKDAYYMYQSEWVDEPVLHVFPHWNWESGQTIDVWAYYNNADQVELFLNGKSQGIKSKGDDEFHVFWRLAYEPGTVEVVSRKSGEEVMRKVIRTADEPSQIQLNADRSTIKADGYDLSFVTVDVLDDSGTLAPNADNLIEFEISGPGKIIGTDNGYQASWEGFKTNKRKAWKGKCLVIVQSNREKGEIELIASSKGLKQASTVIVTK